MQQYGRSSPCGPQTATASLWGIASVGAGLGGVVFQSISGITVNNISVTYNYATAYNPIFVGYGILALLGVSIVLFLTGPFVKNEELHGYVEANLTVTNVRTR